MTTIRLARRLAFTSDVRQRWRQVSVVVTGAAATLLLLLGTSLIGAAHESDERIEGRSPVWATTAAGAPLQISLRGLVLPDRYQFPVVWLNPAGGHETDPALVPPGLHRLPAPGEGVLSPGLRARGYSAEDFGLRPSTAGTGPGGTIGIEGLSTSSEGWIYARPALGRTLGTGGALLPVSGYTAVGPRAALETVPQIPTRTTMLVGVLWLLLPPALFLLLGAARAVSPVRDSRAATLLRLGITPLRIRALLAAETAFLVLAGAIPATALWWTVLSHARSLPVTGARLLPESLTLAPWQVLAVVTVTVLLAIGAALFGPVGPRPESRWVRRPQAWQVLPLLLAIATMAASRVAAPPSSAKADFLLFGGLLLTLLGLPLALPVLAAAIGKRMGHSANPVLWLAGRSLTLRPAMLARPAAAVGVLVLVAGGAFAVYGRMMTVEPEQSAEAPLSRFTVSWRDARPGDLDRIGDQVAGLQIVPVRAGPNQEPIAVFDSCAHLAQALRSLDLAPCGPDGALQSAVIDTFRNLTQITPGLADQASTNTTTLDDTVLLLGPRVGATEQDVMQALTPTLPAVNIAELGTRSQPPATVGWLVAGWILTSLLLSLALLRELGDRVLVAMSSDSRLSRLGLTAREVAQVHRWSVLPPVTAAIVAGWVGAIVFSVYGQYLGFTLNYIGRITLVAVAVGAMATVLLGATFWVHRTITEQTSPLAPHRRRTSAEGDHSSNQPLATAAKDI